MHGSRGCRDNQLLKVLKAMTSLIMSRFEISAYRLYEGPCRRGLRALLRPIASARSTILMGPMRGASFAGKGLACRVGLYELHLQHAIRAVLKRGQVFYDIGANNGFFTLLGARCVGSSGHVFAFEPLPQNLTALRTLSQPRQLSCSVVAAAVSDRCGTARFKWTDDDSVGSLLGAEGSSLGVETVTLDEFVRRNRPPDLIKLDVEGAEGMVLAGAPGLLASGRPATWIVELHSEQCAQAVEGILRASGYHVQPLVPYVRRTRAYPRHVIAHK